jgi:hypothetical protein
MSRVAFIALLMCCIGGPPVLALASAPGPAEGPRLVLHAPWADGVALVRRAGGDPVGPFHAPMGVLAFASDNAAFDRRLREAGAWAVVNGTSIAALCGIALDDILEETKR